LSTLKEKFQSKDKLVDQLIDKVKKEEGQSNADVKKILLKTSNRKLLNLYKRLVK
jgi:hypothetical protein